MNEYGGNTLHTHMAKQTNPTIIQHQVKAQHNTSKINLEYSSSSQKTNLFIFRYNIRDRKQKHHRMRALLFIY